MTLLSQTKNAMTPGGAASLVISLWVAPGDGVCSSQGSLFRSPSALCYLVTRYDELFALKQLPVEVALPPPQPWSPTEQEPVFHRFPFF